MKRIEIFLIIIIIVGGILFLCCKNNILNNNLKVKEKNTLEKKEDNLINNCIVIDNLAMTKIECQDNVIYDLDLENSYQIGDIITIKYREELKKENIIHIEKDNRFNYIEDKGIFSNYYEDALKLLKNMTIDEKIGQILLARVADINQIKDLKTYKFGGYLLFKRDFTNKTKAEVIKMIKSYQENSSIPLLIAADEEGGSVSRISSNKNLVSNPFKSPRTLYLEGGLDKIKEDTIEKNKVLERLGINLNLAPVVDVSTNESDYMYKRSLGEDEKITSEFAKTIIQASKDSKVSYTLKHFPGYGNNSDTHIGLSVDTRELDEIKNIDLLPFKAGIEEGAEAILVSHNIVSSIDSNNPASISIKVHNLLRNDLEFTGVIITDDLSMGAINDYYKEGAVVNAINSGNDLLIVTDYKNSIKEIKNAINDKELSENIINKRVLRILAWKYYKGLIK